MRSAFQSLHGLEDVARVVRGAREIGQLTHRRFHPRPSAGPSVVHLLLAGLAVFAFAKLLSTAQRPGRFAARKLIVAALLVAVGAVLMSLRRSGLRHRW